MEINIQSIHFTADEKLEKYVTSKIEKLKKFYDNILGAQVFLKLDHGSAEIKDKVVEIKLQLPGNILFASDISRSFEESIDISFENLKTQLVKHKEKIKSKF